MARYRELKALISYASGSTWWVRSVRVCYANKTGHGQGTTQNADSRNRHVGPTALVSGGHWDVSRPEVLLQGAGWPQQALTKPLRALEPSDLGRETQGVLGKLQNPGESWPLEVVFLSEIPSHMA